MEENQFGPITISSTEKARLDGYKKYSDLITEWAENHDKLFQADKLLWVSRETLHLYVNFPDLVIKTAADLVLSEPPILSVDDDAVQERIDGIARRSRLYQLAWRALYWTGGLGDGFFVVADRQDQRDAKPSPVLTFRKAVNSIARNMRIEDPPFDRKFVFKSSHGGVEIYSTYDADGIRRDAFQDGERVALPENMDEFTATKLGMPLVVHMAALRGNESEAGFGESDFSSVEEQVFEIAHRLRQVSKVLDDHSEPPMNVPEGILDENGRHNVRENKVFERGVDGRGAEYVDWQSQLESNFNHIDRLINIIALMTQTSTALWGLDKDGQVESGRALKFKLLTSLGKARRNREMLATGLCESMTLALQREDILNNRSPGEYEIDCILPDTFIADELETAELVERLARVDAISVQRRVEIGQGLSGEELDEETQRIKDETEGVEIPGFGQVDVPEQSNVENPSLAAQQLALAAERLDKQGDTDAAERVRQLSLQAAEQTAV